MATAEDIAAAGIMAGPLFVITVAIATMDPGFSPALR
jgi:hypothetical protein